MLTERLKIYVPKKPLRVKARFRPRSRTRPAIIQLPISEDSLLESLAYRNGQVYDSYLAFEPDRERFWSSDHSGVVTYVNVAGHLKVGGGLLAKDENKPQLLAEFLEFVRKNHRSAVFFNITENDLPLFQRYGIQATKWGEDALIDLPTWNCLGKPFEWLRRQKNFCTRHRIQCTEWQPAQSSEEEFCTTCDELKVVAADSLNSKAQLGVMRFFEGQLDLNRLGRKRIFVARADNGLGRIEAFVIANPYSGGKGWAFEIYRHRQDSVRGVVPHLKLAAMEIMKSEGIEQVSLCLIPGLNCHSAATGDSGLVRRLLNLGTRYLNSIFDTAGLYHYKSRFRPRFESRYVCAYPRSSPMSVLTSAHLMGIFNVSLARLARRIWNQFTNKNRSTLAKVRDKATKSNVADFQPADHH